MIVQSFVLLVARGGLDIEMIPIYVLNEREREPVGEEIEKWALHIRTIANKFQALMEGARYEGKGGES